MTRTLQYEIYITSTAWLNIGTRKQKHVFSTGTGMGSFSPIFINMHETKPFGVNPCHISIQVIEILSNK